jgi:hypothetical protein
MLRVEHHGRVKVLVLSNHNHNHHHPNPNVVTVVAINVCKYLSSLSVQGGRIRKRFLTVSSYHDCLSTTIFPQPKMSRPYNDAFMVTAQTLSIVAFLVSWIWYVTFILGGIAMILMQVIWCCRVGRGGLISTSVISCLTSVGCFVAGIIMIVKWKGDMICHIFRMTDDDTYSYNDDAIMNYDYCNEVAWAMVGFATGFLWAATAVCVLVFVTSGRYERCVQLRTTTPYGAPNRTQENEVELGPIPAAIPYSGNGEEEANHFMIPAASIVVSGDDHMGISKV